MGFSCAGLSRHSAAGLTGNAPLRGGRGFLRFSLVGFSSTRLSRSGAGLFHRAGWLRSRLRLGRLLGVRFCFGLFRLGLFLPWSRCFFWHLRKSHSGQRQ